MAPYGQNLRKYYFVGVIQNLKERICCVRAHRERKRYERARVRNERYSDRYNERRFGYKGALMDKRRYQYRETD